MTLRVALLEDEPPARRQLIRLLREVREETQIVLEAETVEAAIVGLPAARPDLVVSDIQLADGLAFAALGPDLVSCPVLFTTAYDQYVLDAFSAFSLDYLLKPIDGAALARALAKLERVAAHFERADLRPLAAQLSGARPEFRKRLMLRRGAELRPMPTADIAYVRAEDKLTIVVDRVGREGVTDATLTELEAQLDPAAFVRASRRYLVAIDAVVAVRSAGKGRLELVVAPAVPRAEPIIVSQEHARSVRQRIDS